MYSSMATNDRFLHRPALALGSRAQRSGLLVGESQSHGHTSDDTSWYQLIPAVSRPASSSARCSACTPLEVVELEGARQAVGEDHGLGVGRERRPYRRQQVGLRDRDRGLVVALLDAPVAGQTAAAGYDGHGRAGALEQRAIGGPAEDRGVVAVRLRDDAAPR